MLLAYSKHIADLAQQFQTICPDGLTNGLRPYRNTLICVGATAAACVAIGATVKVLRRRDITKDPKILTKDNAKCIVAGEMPIKAGKQKPILKQRQVGDDISSDCESEMETELANIKLDTSVNARIHQAFYTRCDKQDAPKSFALD